MNNQSLLNGANQLNHYSFQTPAMLREQLEHQALLQILTRVITDGGSETEAVKATKAFKVALDAYEGTVTISAEKLKALTDAVAGIAK